MYVPALRRVPFALVLGDDRDPIRVLRVIARLNVGGPSLHVSYLTEGLSGRGYRTTLAAGRISGGEGDMAFVAAGRGIDVEWIPHLQREISPLRDVAVVRQLAQLIRHKRPHVLHTHTAKAGAVGRLAAARVRRCQAACDRAHVPWPHAQERVRPGARAALPEHRAPPRSRRGRPRHGQPRGARRARRIGIAPRDTVRRRAPRHRARPSVSEERPRAPPFAPSSACRPTASRSGGSGG